MLWGTKYVVCFVLRVPLVRIALLWWRFRVAGNLEFSRDVSQFPGLRGLKEDGYDGYRYYIEYRLRGMVPFRPVQGIPIFSGDTKTTRQFLLVVSRDDVLHFQRHDTVASTVLPCSRACGHIVPRDNYLR
ncbi:hypothetical protein F5Y14DRAFT_402633 [Nemania sp. NC0429]|nr:hypothetical protein F5Y14DRAFT_402633 [Nemania sp. NC0429]